MSELTHWIPLHEAIDACLAGIPASSSGIHRVSPVIRRFAGFCEEQGIRAIGNVTPSVVELFVNARVDAGVPASTSTRHNRRSAVRLLFRVARRQGLVDFDPTVDLTLPARSTLPTRPLTDDEVELCRDVAWWASGRVAGAWALAETTARGAELGAISHSDVDLSTGTVRIHGGARTDPRLGELTTWGIGALVRRFGEVSDGRVACSDTSSGLVSQVSTCRAIGTVLLRAGLAGERDVRPSSVAAWAGRRVFLRTGRIEDAAAAMGVRSLDRAARLVGHDWMG